MNIKCRVFNLIKKYKTRNPFKLAKLLDIEIIFENLGDTKGFFKKVLRKKFIFINSELSSFEQKVICAHELGHALFHSSSDFQFMLDNTSLIKKTKVEDEANLFVSWLLFDDSIEDEYNLKGKDSIDNYVLDNIINLKYKNK